MRHTREGGGSVVRASDRGAFAKVVTMQGMQRVASVFLVLVASVNAALACDKAFYADNDIVVDVVSLQTGGAAAVGRHEGKLEKLAGYADTCGHVWVWSRIGLEVDGGYPESADVVEWSDHKQGIRSLIEAVLRDLSSRVALDWGKVHYETSGTPGFWIAADRQALSAMAEHPLIVELHLRADSAD